MTISWEELNELGVDWMDFCELTGTSEWARNEGFSGTFEISTENLKKLVKKS